MQRFGEGADTLAVDDVSMAGLDLGARLERGPCTYCTPHTHFWSITSGYGMGARHEVWGGDLEFW